MYLQSPCSTAATPRRGIVLLVVISLLTIFTVAGIAFVYYADAKATASRHYREGTNFKQPDMDPELMLAYFLQQLIFDTADDESGIYSALRGHSLLRNMYGYNDAAPNAIPWNGIGRISENLTIPNEQLPSGKFIPVTLHEGRRS